MNKLKLICFERSLPGFQCSQLHLLINEFMNNNLLYFYFKKLFT